MVRDGVATKIPKGRRARKELKTRLKKVKGTEKAKIRESGGDKKKR